MESRFYLTNNESRSVTVPLGNTTSYGYDRRGLRTSVTDPEDHTTTTTYNALSKVTRRSEPYQGDETHDTTYDYYLNGLKKSETDGEGRTLSYAYDCLGRLTAAVTDPGDMALTTNYAYDSVGNLTSVADPRENTVLTMTYDNLGRMRAESDFVGNTYTYEYDPSGNLTSTTDPEGAVIDRTYNNAGLISTLDPPGTDDDVTYTYDSNLNYDVLSSREGAYTLSFDHDQANRTTSLDSSLAGSPELTYTQEFSYDRRGSLTGLASDGNHTTYTYDRAGRLTGASDDRLGGTGSYNLTRNPDGTLHTLTGPAGETTTTTYYENNLTAGITTKRAGGHTLSEFSYTYDRGNLTESADKYIEGNPASDLYTYSYDSAGRLTGAASDSGAVDDITYAYDSSGNMFQKTVSGSTTTYTYDRGNRLIFDSTGTDYTYDACGRLTDKEIFGSHTTYDYDALARMESATVGGNTVSYSYDPLSRMTGREEGGETTHYRMLGTGDQPLSATGSSGTTSYLWTPDAGRPLALIDDTGETHTLLTNAHTDVVATLDSGGNLTSSTLYRPYGEKQESTGTLSVPLSYQGDLTDPTTGLVDMGVRNYDPATSRFTTPDPLDPRTADP